MKKSEVLVVGVERSERVPVGSCECRQLVERGSPSSKNWLLRSQIVGAGYSLILKYIQPLRSNQAWPRSRRDDEEFVAHGLCLT